MTPELAIKLAIETADSLQLSRFSMLLSNKAFIDTGVLTDGTLLRKAMFGTGIYFSNREGTIKIFENHGVSFGSISSDEMIKSASLVYGSLPLETLVAKGGDVNARNENGESVANLILKRYASSEADKASIRETFKLIISHPSFIADANELNYFIRWAAVNGHTESFIALMERAQASGLAAEMLAGENFDQYADTSSYSWGVKGYTLLEAVMTNNDKGKNDDVISWLQHKNAAFKPTQTKLTNALYNNFGATLIRAILDDRIADDAFIQDFMESHSGIVSCLETLAEFLGNRLVLGKLNYKPAEAGGLVI